MNDYTKLKDLVGSTFEVLEVQKYLWKKWDDQEKKMLTSDLYVEGYRKVYPVLTNKGRVDMGSGQLGNLLEAVFYQGKADLINKTFEVKSNGKQGMDIRYYFNLLAGSPGGRELTYNASLQSEETPQSPAAPAPDLPPASNYDGMF